MKIDRLIGILSILLQHEKVTAPYLADRFEVSRRTINRDIEDICRAGIPIVTIQGANGGISIMEGYQIDRTLLTKADLQAILTGLKSLDSVSGTNKYQQLMDKISLKRDRVYTADNHILIDLSSYYKSSLSWKFGEIQRAIQENRVISFYYYGPKGEGEREIEPSLLVFQWSSWYVRGFCKGKQEFRLFKLNRLEHLTLTERLFEPKIEQDYECLPETPFQSGMEIVAAFEPCVKWRLIEEYGIDCFANDKDGKLIFRSTFTNKNYLLNWILSFGDQVELLEPKELRVEMLKHANGMYQKYFQS